MAVNIRRAPVRTYDKAWFDAITPDLAKGLRGGIATMVPFYLAVRLGRHELAWMALGGWLGTLVDPGGLRSTRAKTLSAFAIAGGLALAMSEGLAPIPWLATFTVVAVAFAASLLRSLGAVWASVGTMLAVVVAVATARGSTAPLRDGGFFSAGAGFGVLLSSVIWPIWTHLPLRRAEANVFEALADYARDIGACVQAGAPEGDPRWVELTRTHHRLMRNSIEEARRLALGGRARRAGETRIGSNLRVLLGLAEAQLPLLITFKEASELDVSESGRPDALERLRALARRDLDVAVTLRTPSLRAHQMTISIPPPGHAPGRVSSIAALLAHLDDASRTAHSLASALDSRADSAAESVRPPGPTWHDAWLRWRADLTVLRDACSPRSTFFHHGLRVAGAVLAASLVARRVSVHPQWVTATTLAVLQPYSGATAARAAQRVLGTVLGCLVAVAITLTVASPLWLSAIMFPLSVAAVATHRRNYRLFTFFLTPVFVLLAERHPGDWWTAAVRASDAALGGGIAFVAAVLVFPSRERTRLPELLGKMLDAVAHYAAAVLGGVSDRHAEAAEASVTGARRDAGIALGEAESSLERLLAEPRHDTSTEAHALQLITYARRVTSALTTIDTYAARDLDPDAELSRDLARSVEAYAVGTLERAATFARGRPTTPDLPIPELPKALDPHLQATLSRLLRGTRLVAEASQA